jgi:hypothetical protein
MIKQIFIILIFGIFILLFVVIRFILHGLFVSWKVAGEAVDNFFKETDGNE